MQAYTHFDNLTYLQSGTPVQQAAYRTLSEHHIWERLEAFTPILAGTIPIDINIDNSDLDILCTYDDHRGYIENLIAQFSHYPGFRLYENNFQDIPAVIAGFMLEHFPVEIFAQPIPVKEQWAYRHMLIEHDLLHKHGEEFRQKVIALKQQGYKTEPAFAQLLGLTSDPYKALLEIPLS
jgi:hypothetical protein